MKSYIIIKNREVLTNAISPNTDSIDLNDIIVGLIAVEQKKEDCFFSIFSPNRNGECQNNRAMGWHFRTDGLSLQEITHQYNTMLKGILKEYCGDGYELIELASYKLE